MTVESLLDRAAAVAIPDTLLDHAPELFGVYQDYARAVRESAEESLSPRLYAMLRLAVALAIPSAPLAREARRLAEERASATDIAGAVNAASHLRSGAAIAYGRLVFKLMEGDQPGSAEAGTRSQIARDREYMTKLRKASPKAFDAMARLTTVRQTHSVISPLEYEMIAIAIATVTQCVYCLEVHGNKAKEVGATEQQIADAVHIAIAARYEATVLEWAALG